MFNELYQLAQTLDRLGVRPPKRCPQMKSPAQGPGLVVCLDEKGNIASATTEKNMDSLWVLSESNHANFPVINLRVGHRITSEQVAELESCENDETKHKQVLAGIIRNTPI